jgi:hypothetical protein
MLIFDGWSEKKTGHVTITILSIAHMGIPNWAIPTVLVMKVMFLFSFSIHLHSVKATSLMDTR